MGRKARHTPRELPVFFRLLHKKPSMHFWSLIFMADDLVKSLHVLCGRDSPILEDIDITAHLVVVRITLINGSLVSRV